MLTVSLETLTTSFIIIALITVLLYKGVAGRIKLDVSETVDIMFSTFMVLTLFSIVFRINICLAGRGLLASHVIILYLIDKVK